MNTVKFYTLGCKVNQYETQAVREQFQRAGFCELEDSTPADVCVVNTCTVTQRADRSSLYFIRRLYRQNPDAKIIVTGCLTEFDTQRITSVPGVSLVVRNKDKGRIVSLLHQDLHNKSIDTAAGITYFKNHSRAFLKIQEGCNYHCSYCKVRLVRGESRSQALSKIKQEAAALIKNGYLEIVLSGICLGSYGEDLIPKSSLVNLIKDLQAIRGNYRIRLSSIEVNDITDELIQIIKKSNRLCRHLHIPVQSGDEQILRQMKRAYSRDDYIALIQRIRRYLPEIAITTDVMVGFPGETEINFRNTLELIKLVGPLRVHIFPFSKRFNTLAYNSREFVPESKIKSRIASLQRVTQGLSLAYCEKFVSQTLEALIERPVKGCADLWEGYTDNYIKVRVKSKLNLKNRLTQVRLSKVYRDFALADIV